MSATCEETAEQLTRQLGFDCHDVSPVVSVHNPFDLASWTQPVLEVLIIAGAVFTLVHAIRRFREGDPINLALWFAPLVYLFVTEPPLYFPEWFGLDKQFGFIFAHNIFTVQFMWDRLPLYIIAIYPALTQLAYELVRVLGIFKRGALIGSIAVAFECQVFYEIFDQLGPQLKWWAWNDDNTDVNHPALASVPMNSMVLFASVSFGVMTYLVVRLVGSKTADGGPRSGWSLTWRILLAGVLAPPAMSLFGIPSSIFGGDTPNVTAQAWVLGIELGLIWLTGAWILITHLRRPDESEPMTPFARIYPAAYLTVFAALWLASLPAFLGAKDGVTSDGTPIGSGLYTIACFIGAAAVLAVLHTGRRRAKVLVGSGRAPVVWSRALAGSDSVVWMIRAQPAATTFLAELGLEDREALQARAGRRRFPAGTTMMYEGQAGTEVMVIISGLVKVTYLEIDGREIVLDFRGQGELLGELAVVDGKPRSSSVEAIEPTEVLAVTAVAFKALLAEHSGIASALLQDVVRRFRDADRKRIEFGASHAIGRVVARLVEMVERFGTRTATGYVIDLPITQEELAGWTGSSREAVAKALHTLRELGLITTERRRLTVLDLEGLERHRR